MEGWQGTQALGFSHVASGLAPLPRERRFLFSDVHSSQATCARVCAQDTFTLHTASETDSGLPTRRVAQGGGLPRGSLSGS